MEEKVVLFRPNSVTSALFRVLYILCGMFNLLIVLNFVKIKASSTMTKLTLLLQTPGGNILMLNKQCIIIHKELLNS